VEFIVDLSILLCYLTCKEKLKIIKCKYQNIQVFTVSKLIFKPPWQMMIVKTNGTQEDIIEFLQVHLQNIQNRYTMFFLAGADMTVCILIRQI
jgi:hypothetical protein